MQAQYEAQRTGQRADGVNIEQSLRKELGDTEYERYLKANGRSTEVRVNEVLATSAAERSGLKAGDEIVLLQWQARVRCARAEHAGHGGRSGWIGDGRGQARWPDRAGIGAGGPAGRQLRQRSAGWRTRRIRWAWRRWWPAWRLRWRRVGAATARRPDLRQRLQTLKRKCMTSPSLTMYSLPSSRSFPASFAPASPLQAM